MKKAKFLPIGVAVTMFLSSLPVMALPINTLVLGKKAFSINALMANVTGIQGALDAANGQYYLSIDGTKGGQFFNLFDPDMSLVTDQQKRDLGSVDYADYDSNNQFTHINYSDFWTIAGGAATSTPVPTATPTATPSVTVSSATVVNNTQVNITLSNGATVTVTGLNLVSGTNTVNFNYNNKSYSTTVSYTVAQKAAVASIDLVNYRNLKVSFNTVVDATSAVDPRNYYVEIVDGDAGYGAYPDAGLGNSNELSQIDTDYSFVDSRTGALVQGAAAWWNTVADPAQPSHIVTSTVNGATVVNIYLPEDARFTNVYDADRTPPDDTERTLNAAIWTSKVTALSTGTDKVFTKDTNANVVVRNVKDSNGKLNIDTAVKAVKILDTIKPDLAKVSKVAQTGNTVLKSTGLGEDLGTFNLIRTLPAAGQVADKLAFEYTEPVFDAHDLDKSDLESKRNIALYVNGNLIADSLNTRNLADADKGILSSYFNFDMGDSTYGEAKVATLDAEKAVLEAKRSYGELFSVNKDYQIRIVGVTDLAGNIEVSSQHYFNVRFSDNAVPNPTIPQVLDIVQVADNVFRVEFNREGASGILKIKDPDGEGVGELQKTVPPSVYSTNDSKYYSYVDTRAKDSENETFIASEYTQDRLLAYDKQDQINRVISVESVAATDTNGNHYLGNSFFKNNMALKNDIKSPAISTPATVDYSKSNTSIIIPVSDVTPWVNDSNITRWVSPIMFDYDATTQRFSNNAADEQYGTQDDKGYMPLIVSYADATGAEHQAVVSNLDVRPGGSTSGGFDLNPGYANSITWDKTTQSLKIDLSKYTQLLDTNGALVAGTDYKVQIPAGYFTDAPRDVDFDGIGKGFTFGGYDVQTLYTDDARQRGDAQWSRDAAQPRGIGYTTPLKTVAAHVNAIPTTSEQLVPQTSKQLIHYDEPTKSIKIEFTGNIDVATLKDKNNYSFNGKTLAQWDAQLGTTTEVRYIETPYTEDGVSKVRKYAIFVVPQDSISKDGDYDFTVSGWKHPEGAVMTPVETVVGLRDNTRPTVIEAVATGDRTIRLTFDEQVTYLVDPSVVADQDSAARNFQVIVNGQVWTVLSAKMAVDGSGAGPNGREVILTIGNALSTVASNATVQVKVVKDQNNNILVVDESIDKNPMRETTYNVSR